MAFDGTFRKLSITEREALLASGTRRTFKAGQVIIRQGSQLVGIYVVIAGEVRVEHGFPVVRQVVVKKADGTQAVEKTPGRLSVEVTRLGRGAIFGDMSFIDDSPTSASVSAIGDVETVFIDGGKVHTMLDRDPSFAARFYHSLAVVLSERLREANKRARGGRPRSAGASLPAWARGRVKAAGKPPAKAKTGGAAAPQAPGVQR